MLASARTRTNARTKKLVPSPELCSGLQGLRSDLFGRALKLTRSPETAEDLVQDTVERAIRFQHHFQHGTNLRAWAHQILFSIFISRCRRRRLERAAHEVLGNAEGAWTLGQKAPATLALSPPVARAFEALPLNFRAALVLVDLEEMSYRDAATLLGVPVGTVMSRLHRGRALMAAELGSPDAMRAAA